MKLKPNDQFQVIFHHSVGANELERLSLLYQPIIGSLAVTLYQRLIFFAKQKNTWSDCIKHATFLPLINSGIDQFEKSRHALEAVGLMKSYVKKEEQLDYQKILYYELLPTLTAQEFLSHPLLNTALYRQVGEESYLSIVEYFSVDDWNKNDFQNISKSYSDVFRVYQTDVPVNESIHQDNSNVNSVEMPPTFNYSLFLRYLIAEGIEHTQFTSQLRESIAAIHQVYQLDEEEMLEVIKNSLNPLKNTIQLNQLKIFAERKVQQKEKQNVEKKPRPVSLPKQDHNPLLSQADMELVSLCEHIPAPVFLNKIKQNVGGFATDSESYYLITLSEKSELNEAVINMLVYYLLVFKQRDNIYKGELERMANLWQKQGIDTAANALLAIYSEEEKAKEKETKQTNSQSKKWYQKDHRRVEELPDWLIEQEKNKNDGPSNVKETKKIADATSNEREQEIRSKLNQLLNEGGD
ncbi:DnaD domain protein [Fundicoccus sp. Sow4_H7]|uniref:DnaD domain protein n=1 Tax=Fundicoccus sp. Sow4_H7 TaxID=3438784 RepID=UPI003F8E374B